MKHSKGLFLLALLAGFVVVGCGKSGGDRLVGTWAIDSEATAAAATEEMSEPERALLDSMAVTMTFGEDGTATMSMGFMGQSRQVAGTYEVTATDGNALTVELTGDNGDTKTLTFTFDGSDRFSTVDDDMTMVLARQ